MEGIRFYHLSIFCGVMNFKILIRNYAPQSGYNLLAVVIGAQVHMKDFVVSFFHSEEPLCFLF